MDATTQPQSRRFRITPGHFVLALLALEVLLWLSERFGWLGWHKGYAVLVCVAVVGVVMLAMVVWFGVAVVFRPRFQFGVRTLLVLTVAVAIPSSWVAVEMKNAREQKAAVEEFQNGGALVNYDYFGKPETEVPAWLRYLMRDEFFTVVEGVQGGADITDATLKHVKALPNLRVVDLSLGKISDDGLENLKALGLLDELVLTFTNVTDDGLKHIHGLVKLERLDLTGTRVTDNGMERLKGLSQLQYLALNSTGVTEAGLSYLDVLPRLQELQLDNVQITDEGLKRIVALTRLKEVHLGHTRISDAGLAKLARLPRLQSLGLAGTQISDAGLSHLEELTQLQELVLIDTKVTAAGVAKLQQALPNCKITC